METIGREVARNIAALITQKNRSKKSVAEEAGLPLTTFSRKLNGGGDFTISEISHVADALGVHPATLFPESFIHASAA